MRSSIRRHRPASVLLGALLAGALPAGSAEPERPAFHDRVEVELGELRVFVRDGDGAPVRDLGAEDFTLYLDDARLQLVAVEAPGAGPATGDRLAIYADLRRLTPRRRARLLGPALRALVAARLAAGSEVLVAGFDPQLRFLTGWSRDPAAVGAALEQLAGRPPAVAALELEAERRRRRPASAGDGVGVRAERTAFERRYRADLAASRQALEALVAVLAGTGRHTAVVLITDGVDHVPDTAAYVSGTTVRVRPDDDRPGVATPTYQYLVTAPRLPPARPDEPAIADGDRRLIAAANAAGITFFPLLPVIDTAGGGTPLAAHRARSATLTDLARWTGGAAVPTERLGRALDRLAARLRSPFTLVYRSPAGDEPVERRVRVAVARPDLAVDHRRTVDHRPWRGALAGATLAALHLGAGEQHGGLQLEPGVATAADRRTLTLPVTVTIAAGTVGAPFELCLAARDAEGAVSPVQLVRLPAGPGPHRVRLALRLRPGRHDLAVGVGDQDGDQAFARASVLLPPAGRR